MNRLLRLSLFRYAVNFQPLRKRYDMPSSVSSYFEDCLSKGVKLTFSQMSFKLNRFARQTKKNKGHQLSQPVRQYLQEALLMGMNSASYTDLANLLYFQCESPTCFEQEFREKLLTQLKVRINSSSFITECPHIEFVEILFYALKMRAYPLNDEIWVKFIKSAPDQSNPLPQWHLGLFLWSLAKLHQFNRSKKSSIHLHISELWNQYADEIFILAKDMQPYTIALIMQSLCTMNIYSDQIWEALLPHFLTQYRKQIDDYTFTYGLWGIARYFRNTQNKQTLLKTISSTDFVSYIRDNYKQFSNFHLLMSLWSLQQLEQGNPNFWSYIFSIAIKPKLQENNINFDDMSLIVQICSRKQLLENADWKTCEEKLCAQIKGSLSEKSAVSVYHAFSLNGKGSSEFWSKIESCWISNEKQFTSKSLASIAYSLTRRTEVNPETVQWLVQQFNQQLKDKQVSLGQLALILWSLTHHPHRGIDWKGVQTAIIAESPKGKPKDLTQLTWSLGMIGQPLEASAQLALYKSLKSSITMNELNENDVSQLLQSVTTVLNVHAAELIALLLNKYAPSLNAAGVSAALHKINLTSGDPQKPQQTRIPISDQQIEQVLYSATQLSDDDIVIHRQSLLFALTNFLKERESSGKLQEQVQAIIDRIVNMQ